MIIPVVIIWFANSITLSYQNKFFMNSLSVIRDQLNEGHAQKVINVIDESLEKLQSGKHVVPNEITQKLQNRTN